MADTKTPYHFYEMGSNQWVNASSYPLVNNYTSFYLNSNGTLTNSAPTSIGSDSINWTSLTSPGGTLVYTSSPFENGASLNGRLDATLYVTSNRPNVELIAELDEVAPDGTTQEISRGSLIGSLRAIDTTKSWYDQAGRLIYPYHPFTQASEQPVPIGQVERYDISMSTRNISISPGYRLSLKIMTQSGSYTGAFGTGSLSPTQPQLTALQGGVYQIEHSSDAKSVINLPMLPYNYFKASNGITDWTTAGIANVKPSQPNH
jgi:predicted acyl esterase